MKQYKVSSYSIEIREVDVIKETAKFVTIKLIWTGGEGIRRESNQNYYRTFKEAKESLVLRCQRNLESAESQLAMKIDDLNKANSLI